MIIRKVSGKDLTPKALLEIGEVLNAGWAAEKIPRVFSPTRFKQAWDYLLESTISALFFLYDDNHRVEGLIGGSICPDHLTDHIFGADIVWKVSPQGKGYGVKLLEEFETWATSMGATKIIISSRVDKGDAQRVFNKLKTKGYVFSGYQMMKGV